MVLRVARRVVKTDGSVCARIGVIFLILRVLEPRCRIRLAPLVSALGASEEVFRFRRLSALLEDARRLRERTCALERHLAVLRPRIVACIVEFDGLEEAGIAQRLRSGANTAVFVLKPLPEFQLPKCFVDDIGDSVATLRD